MSLQLTLKSSKTSKAAYQAQNKFFTNINAVELDFKALVTQATQDVKTFDISSTPSTTMSRWSKAAPQFHAQLLPEPKPEPKLQSKPDSNLHTYLILTLLMIYPYSIAMNL